MQQQFLCYRLQEERSSGFVFRRDDKRDVRYHSKRLATNLCRCLMILTSADCRLLCRDFATDPAKLLRIWSGLL